LGFSIVPNVRSPSELFWKRRRFSLIHGEERMPRKRENRCPKCGEIATEPYKTWELIAPFPDKKMRITVTVFGMFKCPSCGKQS
jgi:predicted RNA-binding Zn-ribbon protein involved in translation (DUF1610 family)